MIARDARTVASAVLPVDEGFERLVELSPDGILVHSSGEVVLANDAAAHLAGATRPDQLLTLPVDSLLDPPYLKAVRGQLCSASGVRDVAQPVRDTLHRLDGVDLPVEIRAVAFTDQGQPSVLLIIRDISDRLDADRIARTMEERLQQAQRMETVGALAGGVAHEVNNMLQVVLGFGASLIQDTRLPAECLPDVREIVQAASRAAAVTTQLLSYSRRAVHRPAVVDLRAAVRDAAPMLRRILGQGQVLEMRGRGALLSWVDPAQLQQVLVNLTLNATAAMSRAGVLRITTVATDLATPVDAVTGSIPAGRYAVIHVRDTGSGMDAVTLRRIFEPFFTTKEIGQGTGLGLAAASGILTQNDGYITVASMPGEGTTFSLYLPAAGREEGLVQPPATVPVRPSSGAEVLVVDDEPGLLESVTRMLRSGGYLVSHAANGAEALEVIQHQGIPDLVLTDLMMPVMGGIELAEQVHGRWPALPLLFMSGYSAELLDDLMHLGAAGELLQKPFTAEDLLAAVQLALGVEAP